MKQIVSSMVILLLITTLSAGPAAAYSHSNRYGGSTSHSEGSTTHTSSYGTSTSHTYGEGTSHTNVYGGSATHATGGGWSKTGAYGGTVSGYGHPAYYPYHPPATVAYYPASGCYGCAAAAGAVVGMAAGAAVASANTSAATSSAYSSGYAAGSANTAATTSAYNAGVAAGSAASTTYVMGVSYATLPAGCITPNVQGKTYYLCGNTWFQPSYGANGVYYRVVPAP